MNSVTIQQPRLGIDARGLAVEMDGDGDFVIHDYSGAELFLDRHEAMELLAALDVLLTYNDEEDLGSAQC